MKTCSRPAASCGKLTHLQRPQRQRPTARVVLLTCRLGAALALVGGLPAAASEDMAWSQRLLQAVNEARQQQGVPALQAAPDLQRIAQGHSDEMAARRRLSHDGFQARFDRTTSSLCVENVAGGTTSPATLVAAWSRAPQHRRNLYDARVRWVGFGASDGYVTLFACE